MDWNFQGVGTSVRPKHLKKYTKLNWKFQRVKGGRGKGLRKKLSSMGEVRIFSGNTH